MIAAPEMRVARRARCVRFVTIVALCFIGSAASAQNVPDLRPGATCEQVRAVYGKESSINGPAHIWKQELFDIWLMVRPDGPCVALAVQYYIRPGHTIQTRDGIVLGKDTIDQGSQKLRGRINDTNFVGILGEGKAYGQLEVPPTATFPFKGTYNWQLSPALTKKLTGPPKRTDFTSEPAMAYFIDHPDPEGMSQ